MQTDATIGWGFAEIASAAAVIIGVLVVAWGAARSLRLMHLRALARATLGDGATWPDDPDGPDPHSRLGSRALAGAEGLAAHPDADRSETAERLSRTEYGAYGAMSAAAIAWGWASIDPDIVAAADFASDTSIQNGYDYVQYVQAHMQGLSEAAKEGFVSRLQGYLGERHVADILMAQGHTVELASTANQPIWDLLMDGDAVNVKTVSDTASVLDAAAEHPDVTYIVPADAHGDTAHNVIRLEGFSHDTVQEAVHESLAAAHGDTALQWIMHNVPWVTLGFSAIRQYHAVEKGRPVGVAIHHGLADAVGRGGGALLGAKVGAGIGTLAGPIGTLVGTAAGALIAAMLGGRLANWWKQRGLRHALEVLKEALHTLGAGFGGRLEDIRGCLHAPLRMKEESLRALESHVEGLKGSWRWWVWPDFQTVLLDEAVLVGREAVQRERTAVAGVDAIISRAQETGRYEEIGLLLANAPVIRTRLGCANAVLEPVRYAREAVLKERRILHPELAEQLR